MEQKSVEQFRCPVPVAGGHDPKESKFPQGVGIAYDWISFRPGPGEMATFTIHYTRDGKAHEVEWPVTRGWLKLTGTSMIEAADWETDALDAAPLRIEK